MNKKFLLAASTLTTVLLSTHAMALQITKPFTVKAMLSGGTGQTKDVMLMGMQLSTKEQNTLLNAVQTSSNVDFLAINQSKLPSAMNLGMNGTPVLDQGMHGSCVTFAITAAIDAILGKGDFVSQLCNLDLGNYLQDNSYLPSGWDGSMGPWVLEQINRFGVVSTAMQKNKGCGGMKEYPTNSWTNEGAPISVEDYKSMSRDVSGAFYPIYRMNWLSRDFADYSSHSEVAQVLQQIKVGINAGHRYTFGTFIVLPEACSVGACATHNAKYDTWAVTKEISVPPFETGGHEMVITGYDDKAVATDAEGKKHVGLLILRNSWGDTVGDNGTYYMSYEYFMKFAGEVQEMVPAPTQQ